MTYELNAAGLIMLVTIVMSLIAFQNQKWKDAWILHPWKDVQTGRYYTLLSSGFIHADVSHLGFNMLSFYFFAFHLEEAIGAIPFTIIYILSIIISDLPTFFKFKDKPEYRSLGASGGVSAILFSFIVMTLPFRQDMMLYVFFIPMPTWLFGILYLAYSFYMSKKGGDFINHDAHLYGALSGIVLILLLKPGLLENWIYFIHTLLSF
jgi:membrane associated rhomboid family serine protease